jgi:WD40 repeat protein
MWYYQGGNLLKTMTGGGTTRVRSVVGDGTRKRIVSGDTGGVIRIFSIESGACTEVLFSPPAGRAITLALLGGVLLAGCWDSKIRSWDLSVGSASMREFEDVKSANCGVWSLIVQEGVVRKRVISTDHTGKVGLWDVEEARCLSVVLPCDTFGRRPLIGQVLAADWHRLVYADGSDMKMLDLSLNALDLSVVSVA